MKFQICPVYWGSIQSLGTLVFIVLTFLYSFVVTRSYATVSLYRGTQNCYHLIISHFGRTDIPIVSIDVVASGQPGLFNEKSKLDDFLKRELETSLYSTREDPIIISSKKSRDLEIKDNDFFKENIKLADILVDNPKIYLAITYLNNRGKPKTTGIELLDNFDHEYVSFEKLKSYLIANFKQFPSGTLTNQVRFF